MQPLPETAEQQECQGRIMIKVGPTCWKALDLKNVLYVKSGNGESRFFTVDGSSHRNYREICELYPLLYSYGFRRCHRCYMVNLDFVDLVVKRGDNDYELALRGEEETRVPLSRSNREFRQAFHWT